MAGSSDFLFDPKLADMIDEAFERAGIDPADVTLRHINAARRSMNFMFSDWQTHGVSEWAVEKTVRPVTPGMTSFDLPDGGIDILEATLRRSGLDTEMYPISRGDYQAIPKKDLRGLPDRYWVDRNTGAPTVYIWQIGENSTDEIHYWYMRRFKDVGSLPDTLDIPSYFYDAFVAGVAARLAVKFAPDRVGFLQPEAERSFNRALDADGSRAPLTIRARYR
ncbi:hypothetical protein [Salinisphaera hydrothermalis]|uniref:Uncharacterized protein n=1 Tax=Salinisphaera hydrothermalis (strain C41B8) TaxID=1304275 RepID=A0A084INM5_SALHC|nr:hypothetical protein [Salinisphaera hydrothermalis]KEZ78309.1 hypothetical protein C41B8_05388 [Salinisphaera hydrothermalis C41B8]